MSEFNQDPTKLDIIKDGRYTYYDEDDESLLIKNYKDGKLNGPSYFHYVSGELWIETNFHDGLEHGILKYYEKDGSILKTEIWENGEYISSKELLEDFKKQNPEGYKKYIEDPVKYEKDRKESIRKHWEDRETRQIEELREINPQRQDLTEEDFYKRILYENYSTFGYYYISGYTPKEEQNIWVHDIDEESRLDTRIKFSESDVNLIMTTDEFKELIESQNYKSSESVEVVGRILKERGISFVLREVVLD